MKTFVLAAAMLVFAAGAIGCRGEVAVDPDGNASTNVPAVR